VSDVRKFTIVEKLLYGWNKIVELICLRSFDYCAMKKFASKVVRLLIPDIRHLTPEHYCFTN
jgi:hypothetical protein